DDRANAQRRERQLVENERQRRVVPEVQRLVGVEMPVVEQRRVQPRADFMAPDGSAESERGQIGLQVPGAERQARTMVIDWQPPGRPCAAGSELFLSEEDDPSGCRNVPRRRSGVIGRALDRMDDEGNRVVYRDGATQTVIDAQTQTFADVIPPPAERIECPPALKQACTRHLRLVELNALKDGRSGQRITGIKAKTE